MLRMATSGTCSEKSNHFSFCFVLAPVLENCKASLQSHSSDYCSKRGSQEQPLKWWSQHSHNVKTFRCSFQRLNYLPFSPCAPSSQGCSWNFDLPWRVAEASFSVCGRAHSRCGWSYMNCPSILVMGTRGEEHFVWVRRSFWERLNLTYE